MALRAASQGPSGFSFASITTAPGRKTLRSSAARDASVVMRNAAAAVAAADNWRNVLREPLERISLVFIRPSSTRKSFPVILLLSAATRAAGLFHPAYASL